MDRFDPFVKYADVYGDIINWEKDPMNKPQNQNKYFFSDGKTYYEQICKMLRLMSVFKEAFNQIYSNEDEISEAWENFVNNLSASVVEGSEPDVTLTWTDDSVNFEFTMVPGVPGEQGVGITSISFNSDYTMTITLSDGNTYTSMSLKGETGPQGPQGETGSGLQILDVYATLADLQSAHPTGQPGDAYQVGSGGNYILYIWSSSQSAWVQAGTLGTVSPYTSAPLMDGTASAGSQNLYARGDHVHPSDTSRASKEELDALIKTSQTLIDQSFTYRESPAIQDGLARIDKIKGNTLVWNQLVQNGNFANTANWTVGGTSFTVSNNEATYIGNQYTSFSQPMPKSCIGHKVLAIATCKTNGSNSVFKIRKYTSSTSYTDSNESIPASYQTLYQLITLDSNLTGITVMFQNNANESVTINVKNVMLIDLTQIFGAGNEPSTVEDFTSLFSLPYYAYNQGTLLSFNGNGIKTVGFNQWDEEWRLGNINVTTGAYEYTNDMFCSTNFIPVLPKTDYFMMNPTTSTLKTRFYDGNMNYIGAYDYDGTASIPVGGRVFKTPSNCCYFKFATQSGVDVYNNDICLNISNASKNGIYEPYTSSTLSLPISTYFPTGMKSAKNAYDELSETKAIVRIKSIIVDGSEAWVKSTSYPGNYYVLGLLSDLKYPGPNAISNSLILVYNTTQLSANDLCFMFDGTANSQNVNIKNTSMATLDQFKAWLQANPVTIYYELKTPTETDVDLDLDFMDYEDGTEQLLPVNGSVPSTSPVIADMTYLSIDDAMEYILEKLANVPLNTQQILESLEDDVADLQTDVGALQPAVSALQTSVGNINTNIGQLSSTVAGHTSSISDMQSDITDLNTDLSDLSGTVTDHTSRIGTLETGLSTTNGNVQNLETSVSDLDDTVTAQGATVTALDSIIQDISNNPVISSLGSHELGFVAAYVSATLPANTGTRVTIPKPTIFPNNYTPLFIVGMSTGSYNVSICEIPPTFGSSNSVNCRVWNHGSEQTTQITVYILCMRQRQSQ